VPDPFRHAQSLLSQLGNPGFAEASVDAALRKLRPRTPKPESVLLGKLAWEGKLTAVAYLVARGADSNHLSGFTDGADLVPPLANALTSTVARPSEKLQIVKTLLAAGADPNLAFACAHPRDDKKSFRSGTVLDYALAAVVAELRVGKQYDADSQRHARSMLQSYRQTLPLLLDAGATVNATAKSRLKKLVVAPTKHPAFRLAAWTKKALALALRQKGRRDAIHTLCEEYLANPAAIPHREWAKVVKTAIDQSPTFKQVSQATYGTSVSYTDDEGWLCQAWDSYLVLDLLFELLAQQPAFQNPSWSALVSHALEVRRKYDALDQTTEAVEALFSQPWARSHPDYKALRKLEKKTRG